MGNNNIGQDLGLIGAWLSVMADLFTAIGATVSAEPDDPPSHTNNQQQMSDLQAQLQAQKRQLQKQQIQFELFQMQLELKELEQQVKKRKR
ncbi:hypothetical protein ACFSO0_16970 [Brevibacillus sp. GCM10020057]|uniref:hypothetical protein n=1 Tax=Brevibacillus sp. GCM10020057 TaxID=3317327 RepID=UPI003626A537